nr:hypothetical protein [Paenibacillus sp. YPD9-1]
MLDTRIPMVEIFETVEGEGTRAGFPTVFVRLLAVICAAAGVTRPTATRLQRRNLS